MLYSKEVKFFMFNFFSPYVNSFERKVDRFFKRIKSTDSIFSVRKKLLSLMQEDLIIVNVWLEKKFKGYKYLKKSVRKKMYSNVGIIKMKFEEFEKVNVVDLDLIKKELEVKGLFIPVDMEENIKYLYLVMEFLKPGKYYKYIRTASFGKLLRNPDEQLMEGDCNQIVTLYIYLYSLKFPIEDLNIKLLPEHVCLHFRNIDIEATNGTFQHYSENLEVLPITEIISTNLLDLADFREEVQEISPRDMVKSAQLAYALSSLKSIVSKNLNIAYNNLGVAAMNANDFKTAIYYFSKTQEGDSVRIAYKNAAAYYLKKENFAKAWYYAKRSGDDQLQKIVRQNEGVYFYRKDNLDKALDIFKKLGDVKMQQACYGKKYNILLKRVVDVKTLEQAKKHKSDYKHMLVLAQKLGDSSLEKGIRETLSRI